nr:MAG TPA: Histone methyltransferase Tudor domain [Bacteriophage sp.]
MTNLIHLFKVGQKVRCNMDGTFYKGTVKETYTDHIIVDIPEISDHCWFENNLNMDCVYPENNFSD